MKSRTDLETSVRHAEAAGDPSAYLLRTLLDVHREPIGPDDMERIARAAAAGAADKVKGLVRLETQRGRLWTAVAVLGALGVGVGAGWALWGQGAVVLRAAAVQCRPSAEGQLCWIPIYARSVSLAGHD